MIDICTQMPGLTGDPLWNLQLNYPNGKGKGLETMVSELV